MGYTPDLAVGVWVGNNNGRHMSGDGVTTAGPIWRKVIRLYHKDKPVTQFERPPGPIPGVDDEPADRDKPQRERRQLRTAAPGAQTPAVEPPTRTDEQAKDAIPAPTRRGRRSRG